MSTLDRLAFWDRLADCQRVLLVGAGGGFDILCGLPIYARLQAQGKSVFLASLSFSEYPGLVEIRAPDLVPPKIGCELCLALWFAGRGQNVPIYTFGATGVQPTLGYYRRLNERLQLDALVLIDGGTDSLLRGDEPGLGSPGEDVVSLAAASLLQEVPVRLLACIGFGLDAHHHVCHAYVLEAIAELSASEEFLGAFSLLTGMPELEVFQDAVEFARRHPGARPSIIAGSVLAAAQGRFGDHHVSDRTRGSNMLLNPLMSLYWTFEVDGLARRCLYLDSIVGTRSRGEVTQHIQKFRQSVPPRPWMELPF